MRMPDATTPPCWWTGSRSATGGRGRFVPAVEEASWTALAVATPAAFAAYATSMKESEPTATSDDCW
jgi:hypothetical protein